jgi:hypothetical protein
MSRKKKSRNIAKLDLSVQRSIIVVKMNHAYGWVDYVLI